MNIHCCNCAIVLRVYRPAGRPVNPLCSLLVQMTSSIFLYFWASSGWCRRFALGSCPKYFCQFCQCCLGRNSQYVLQKMDAKFWNQFKRGDELRRSISSFLSAFSLINCFPHITLLFIKLGSPCSASLNAESGTRHIN